MSRDGLSGTLPIIGLSPHKLNFIYSDISAAYAAAIATTVIDVSAMVSKRSGRSHHVGSDCRRRVDLPQLAPKAEAPAVAVAA